MRTWATAVFSLFAPMLAACSSVPAADADAAADATLGDGSDITMDAATIDCGFEVQPGADASVCFQATSCNGLPFCPSLVPQDSLRPEFRLTQFDAIEPAISRMPISVVINQLITAGNLRWGLRLDRTAQTLETGMLDPGATPQPGTNFALTEFAFFDGTAPGGDAGTLDPNRWNSVMAPISWPEGSDTWSMIGTLPHLVLVNFASGDEIDYRNVSIHDVRVVGDCIGLGRPSFDACDQGRWFTTIHGVPSGILEFDFTIAGASAIHINGVMGVETLCDILAGASCAHSQRPWPNEPNRHVDSETEFDGWHWIGTFAGVGSDIR